MTSLPSSMKATSPKYVRIACRVWRCIPLVLAGIALVHPLAALVARCDWRADMLTHFQEPALAMTLVAILTLVWRHRRFAAALAVLAAVQSVPLLRYEGTNPVLPEPSSPQRLRILMANVQVDNEDHVRLAQLIRAERPDVVGLVEVSEEWLLDLDEVRREFPFRIEAPQGSRGLALWFRKPPVSAGPPEQLVTEGWPVLHASFEFGGCLRHLWLVHPASPLRQQRRRSGYPELAALAERVRRTGGSKIVVGDLNCTDGSPFFRDFLRVSGLRDSRLGFGRQPSWPAWSPYRIPIDHAFLTPDLAVVNRRLGPNIGSDHRPLILDSARASGTDSARKSVTHTAHSQP